MSVILIIVDSSGTQSVERFTKYIENVQVVLGYFIHKIKDEKTTPHTQNLSNPMTVFPYIQSSSSFY